MTDEDIVKALEICSVVNSANYDASKYKECPYFVKKVDCVERSEKDFLDLIHRLQDDYSKLKERYVKVLDLNEKVIADQKAEIERLTEENGQLKGYNSGLEYENTELQKQVDECEARVTAAYELGYKESKLGVVKDTAKEIYDYIKSIEEHGLPTSCVGEWVKDRLKERYGVEVE